KGAISQSDIDVIVAEALKHARSYLRWLMWNRNYTLAPLGMSIDDIACDAVAELLSEIDGEDMERLRKSLKNVLAPEPREIPLDCAFQAVVLRTVRLNLARVFTEIHPVRARLLRSMRRFEQSSGLIRRHDGLAGYSYSLSDVDPCLERPATPQDVLRAILILPKFTLQPAPAICVALLEALCSHPELRQAVWEDDVLDITLTELQAGQATAMKLEGDDEFTDGESPVQQETLTALTEMRAWVFESYVEKKKLTKEEASAMLRAAEGYILDLARDEDRGHYHYLRMLLPYLSNDVYRSRYRNIYEYIIRTVFTRTRRRLQYNSMEQINSAPTGKKIAK
ncbi:MAG: hypothetical protein KFH87_01475, partial [Bacteroidetes bacterium]|nr:hypothetical protein [Bacteroidota bacterium]